MKKHIYTLIAILACSFAFAQFTYGPKLGVNMSRFSTPKDKFAPGFQAGGFLNAELYDRIGLQADFLWALHGNKHESGPDTAITTFKTNYRYCEIPLCLYFPISKHLRGFAGYQFNVFRKAHGTKTDPKNKETEYDVSGDNSQTWIFGFDFTFDSPLTVGFRWVTNKSMLGPYDDGEGRSYNLNSITLNFGYTMSW